MTADFEPHTDASGQEGISKSQQKRELLALQKIGDRLMNMTPSQVASFPLGPRLTEALEEARRIKGHSARRRHVRRVAKLLRSEDMDSIQQLLDKLDGEQLEEKRRFHQLERWRERLLQDGDSALTELLQICPQADSQQIRQLLRTARKEQDGARPTAAARKLFRYLKELEFV
jgi:ribosome-associated protein